MDKRQRPLPKVWIVTDARNDAALEAALARLPRGSGLIFRHYHLPPPERRARFGRLMRIARHFGHIVALAGDARQARRWGADAAYGAPPALARGPAVLRLATAHSLHELGRARRADAVLLSPVHPTQSHPGASALGPVRFRLIAARSTLPVIALGAMNARRARAMGWRRWAAIDAFLESAPSPRILDGESATGDYAAQSKGSEHNGD